MKLAFYYHVSITVKERDLFMPSYFGVFIDALAKEVEELLLVMHESTSIDEGDADYMLRSQNIKWINLGKKTPAWDRSIFHRRVLKNRIQSIDTCDAFVVRSPTPLAPYFHKYLRSVPIFFMIVGDYKEGAEHLQNITIRDKMVRLYLKHNDWLFRRRMRKTHVFVNSQSLFNKYQKMARSIQQIKTTTLSVNDFYKREDTCQGAIIEILYTGRIDYAKGLFELVEALSILKKKNIPARLNIVGWEFDNKKPVEKSLILKVTELELNSCVLFHGKKSIGDELNAFYRMADIYVIASYHEGFPRTIWEAMANSLPVIATNVGSIPYNLADGKDALLISPKSAQQIAEAVQKLYGSPSLRKTLIANGQEKVLENTLEKQTKNLVDLIHNLV